MGKSLAKGSFYLVVVVLLTWTGSLTVTFVSSVMPGSPWYVPVFALVVFDGGMLSWLKVFIDYAQGSSQRAVAIVASVFDFLGVGVMVIAEIFLGGQTLVAPPPHLGEYAVWAIGIWTVANVGAVIAFHLMDPEARKRMALQVEKDAVFEEALQKLSKKRAQQSAGLSDILSDGMMAQLRSELATDANRDGIPDIYQGGGSSFPGDVPPSPAESQANYDPHHSNHSNGRNHQEAAESTGC